MLEIGASAEASLTVQHSDTAQALAISPGDSFPEVLATSRMILLMEVAAARAMNPMLLDGQADIAVAVEYRGAPRADDQRLTRVPLYAEPFRAVLPLGHRLAAGEGPVAVADLAAEPWIGPYPGNPCHDVVLLACEHAGFQPRLMISS